MRIVLACATQRGCLFLKKLAAVMPGAELAVVSFREEPHEPPFLADLRALTETLGGTFFETRQLGGAEMASFWEQSEIDLLFAVSWRYMIPARIYNRATRGSYVFHDSLLPLYRGFSPTVWAMINGETQTGVTLFEMSDRVDEGDIIAQSPVPIGSDDTIAQVMQRVTDSYLNLLEDNIRALAAGAAVKRPQDRSKATYGCKRLPEDNEIDWRQSSSRIYNLIRATTYPYTGAFTWLDEKKLIIWSAALMPDLPSYTGRVPGRVVEVREPHGAVVLSGDSALLVTRVQFVGAEAQPAIEVIDKLGQTLGR